MARLACINIQALPLQVLLQAHPDWRDRPTVVIDRESPNGLVQWANPTAQNMAIVSGLRYAAARSLDPHLHAGVVSPEQIQTTQQDLLKRLNQLAPQVEQSDDEPGVFWLDASGMQHVTQSLNTWARRIRNDLQRIGFQSSVAVGWSRFGSYALAASRPHTTIPKTPDDEMHSALQVPFRCLPIPPEVRDSLQALGLSTVRDLLGLPVESLRSRYGEKLYRWVRLAHQDLWQPLARHEVPDPIQCVLQWDDEEEDIHRLMFRLKGGLNELLAQSQTVHQKPVRCGFTCRFRDAGPVTFAVEPAEPTWDPNQWSDLLRLRMERLVLPKGVTDASLGLETLPAQSQQIALQFDRPKRNIDALPQAMARLRAEFGTEAVCVAELREAHLPEARFVWKPVDCLPKAQPQPAVAQILVRRMHRQVFRLEARRRNERDDGWQIRVDGYAGAVSNLVGPYSVTGGWWKREVRRLYYFAQLQNDDWLWLYHDAHRRRWFCQGSIE